MPNYRRYHLPGHPVFVTIVTYNRNPWLRGHAELLLSSIRQVKSLYPFAHKAHVVLPDHFHWLFTPEKADDCSRIVAAVKRDVTWRVKDASECLSPPLWQARFYDHVIRGEDDFQCHLDYIHFNPVKHGLVKNPAHYPHSSYAEWVRRGVYPDGWGSVEPEHIAGMELE